AALRHESSAHRKISPDVIIFDPAPLPIANRGVVGAEGSAMRASPLWSVWVLALLAGAAPADQDAPEGVARKYLNAHCAECHGEDARRRDLRLDTLSKDLGKPDNFAT